MELAGNCYNDSYGHVVKHGLDWICKTWTGFVKDGFVNGGFAKHGFVKRGFVKGGFVKHGFVKHGFAKHGFVKGGFVKHGFVKGRFVKHGFVKHGLITGKKNQSLEKQMSHLASCFTRLSILKSFLLAFFADEIYPAGKFSVCNAG